MFRPDPKPTPKVKEVKWPTRKKQKPIKKVSQKQDVIERLYSIVIKKIDIEREPICSGCGRGDKPLSHSHLISRADCNRNGLSHLIADKNNIALHCLKIGDNTYSCHEIWESIHRDTLLDYEANMEYIKSVSPELYIKYSR